MNEWRMTTETLCVWYSEKRKRMKAMANHLLMTCYQQRFVNTVRIDLYACAVHSA